jgi:hypothetical protein
MEATILSLIVAVLYSTAGLALIVLPRRFLRASPGTDRVLDEVWASLGQRRRSPIPRRCRRRWRCASRPT